MYKISRCLKPLLTLDFFFFKRIAEEYQSVKLITPTENNVFIARRCSRNCPEHDVCFDLL